jgi:hypothetical protein
MGNPGFLLVPGLLLATAALGQVAAADPEPPLYMLEFHTLKPGQDTEYVNSRTFAFQAGNLPSCAPARPST